MQNFFFKINRYLFIYLLSDKYNYSKFAVRAITKDKQGNKAQQEH